MASTLERDDAAVANECFATTASSCGVIMGTWEPGNFENDAASEYLDDLTRPLIEHVEQTAVNPAAMEPDELDSVVMICNIEMLACLAEGLAKDDGVIRVELPRPTKIKKWKNAYLKVWDRYIAELNPTNAHKARRREVIVNTFDRLIAAAQRQTKQRRGRR